MAGRFSLIFLIGLALLPCSRSLAQEKYILGEEQKLEIIVHVIGEVQKPGEYRVYDDTDVLELIAKAGGPTEFSNMSGVTITRVQHELVSRDGGSRLNWGKRTIKVNINKYLKEPNSRPLPMLQPGDIVIVPRNNWHKWRSAFAIMRDISVIASLYFLYLRATK